MKKLVWYILCTLLFPFFVQAQTNTKKEKTKVLLLGTFHFDNPGLDIAQFKNADILSPSRQKEVQEVIAHLKRFNPQKIFVEYTTSSQQRLDSLLKLYKEKGWILPANEVYQLGFQLAKALNLPFVQAVDYTGAKFPFDSLVKVLQSEKQFALLQHIKTTIDSIQTSFNESLKTSTLKEILLSENSCPSQHLAVGSYLKLLTAGSKNNHVGTYLASEWWRRNMMIYENILKRLDGNEKTILVIFGSAHTALLKEFMKFNNDLELVELTTVFK